MADLQETLRATKSRLLTMHYESKTGHIGGNLSCIDILMVLYHAAMQSSDELVLSKGHGAGALYATLWSIGVLTDEDLRTFHKDNTRLSGHPAPKYLPEIAFATGSLGHGLSLACGMALGRQLQGKGGRVYCVMSDGEWQEGSSWEALIFAVKHQLPISIIVDTNGLQGFGSTSDIACQGPLTDRFRSFGVPTEEVDGHCLESLLSAFARPTQGLQAVIAKTRKGNGVTFMEDRMEWHYLPLGETQYRQAIEEIGRS